MKRHLLGLLACLALAGTVACAVHDCRCFAKSRRVGLECDVCFGRYCEGA